MTEIDKKVQEACILAWHRTTDLSECLEKDLLDCLHNEQLIMGTVWEGVLISQGKLKREWRKRTRQKKRDGMV